MSYGSSWHGSGQNPARAVCGEGEAGVPPPSAYGQPCIDHFSAVDPSEGGSTQRHMASADYSIIGKDADLRALAYLIKYRFTLYSNFTFFLDDPLHGHEIDRTLNASLPAAVPRAAARSHRERASDDRVVVQWPRGRDRQCALPR